MSRARSRGPSFTSSPNHSTPTERADFLAVLAAERRHGRNAHRDHKTAMLCKQVARALSLTFASSADDVVAALFVEQVEAARGSGVVFVRVSSDQPPSVVYERLGRAASWIRAEVARCVSRKRAPELAFVVTVGSQGGV